MSWQQVARKDFEDVIRSWLLWSIVGVFLLLLGIIGLAVSGDDLGGSDGGALYATFNTLGAQLLVPITALVLGYMAITAERQSGSLRILFGLSHDREDVIAGKLVSRMGAMTVATLVVCVAMLGLILAKVGSVDLSLYVPFLGLTLLLALAFVGIAVGISASTGSRAKSMGGAIGSYVFFLLLWQPLIAAIHYALKGELAGYYAPEWYFFLRRLNPITAYREAMGQLTGQYLWPMVGWSQLVEDLPEGATENDGLLLSNRVQGDLPFYLQEWVSVVVLLAWFAIPVVIGYWRFERADLN